MVGIDFFSVDVLIVVVVLLSFVIGWARGATREILSVVAWVGGFYLAILLFPHAKEFARSYVSHKLIADFVTVCGLFILFLTLLSVFNYFCSNLVKKSLLNTTDKALGGVFGIIRGVAILAALELVVNQCMLNKPPQFIENSRLRPTITSLANFIVLVLPEDWQEKVLSHMSQVKKQRLVNFFKDGVIEKLTPNGSPNAFDKVAKSDVIAENANKPEDKNDDEEFIEEDDIPVKEKPQSAEELATLKPKKVVPEKSRKDVSKKSRNDMDRLLSQYGSDDGTAGE